MKVNLRSGWLNRDVSLRGAYSRNMQLPQGIKQDERGRLTIGGRKVKNLGRKRFLGVIPYGKSMVGIKDGEKLALGHRRYSVLGTRDDFKKALLGNKEASEGINHAFRQISEAPEGAEKLVRQQNKIRTPLIAAGITAAVGAAAGVTAGLAIPGSAIAVPAVGSFFSSTFAPFFSSTVPAFFGSTVPAFFNGGAAAGAAALPALPTLPH